MPMIGIAGYGGRFILSFLRKSHIDFQGRCTNLHSYQQLRSFPLTPHPLQQKLSLVFLILAIQTGVRWYMIHLHNGVLLSCEINNDIMNFLDKWMEGEKK